MTMDKDLHPKDGKDRIYESRKEGGRGFERIDESGDTSKRQL